MDFKTQRAKGSGSSGPGLLLDLGATSARHSHRCEEGMVLAEAGPSSTVELAASWCSYSLSFLQGCCCCALSGGGQCRRFSLGKHPSTLGAWRAKSNSKHAPEMKRERSLISSGSQRFPNPGAPLDRKGQKGEREGTRQNFEHFN